MHRRVVLLVLIFSLLWTPNALAKTKIEWMEWPRPNQDELAAQLIASFEAKHPDIEVVYVPMSSKDQVIVGAAAGTSPDIIGYWGETLTTWMEEGLFLNLDPYLKKYDFDSDDFNPMQLQAFSKGGSQYILPHYLGTGAMMYNRSRFQAAGIPEPDETWTWDDRRDAGRKLTERQDGQIVRWGNLIPYTNLDVVANNISANGGQHHPEGDNSVVLWDSPAAIEALDYWRIMLFEDESAPTAAQLGGVSFRDTFATERAIMFETLAIDLAHYEHVSFEIGITQSTKGPVKRVTRATTDGYGIWTGTPNPDAATKFLLHLTSPEANRLRAQLQSLQPARRSVLLDWVDITLEAFPFVTREDIMQFYYAGEFAEPVPTWSKPEVAFRLLNQSLPRMYRDNQPAAVVMADVVPMLNRILAQH